MVSDVDVVLLAGGFATRLRPLSYSRPKPLLPILDKPLIDWVVQLLSRIPLGRIFVSMRYMGDMVRGHIERHWVELRDRVVFVQEEKPLGDAGPIRLIEENHSLTDPFVLIYGDVFSDVDLGAVLRRHVESDGVVTMTLVEISEPSKYGVVKLGDGGKVIEIVEKPKQASGPALINAGIYVFNKEVIKWIGEGYSKLAVDVLPQLARLGLINGYVHRGTWFDIGTPEDYLSANFKLLETMCREGCINAELPKDVAVEDFVYLGKGVKVGRGSEVGPYAVIHNNVKIGENVKILNSVIFEDSTLSSGSYISGSIVGGGSYIGKWVRVEQGSVLGDGIYVKDGVLIGRGARIGPYREILESIYEEDKVLP